MDYTMSVSLQILKPLAADFDGDVLNILFLINGAMIERAMQIFNPRNAMYINRSDGLFNKSVMVQRDTVINSNTLISLTKDDYNEEDKAKMLKLFKRNGFDKLLKGF